MLRKIRTISALLFGGLITLYFLDFADLLPASFRWLAKVQFVPALVSLSAGVLLEVEQTPQAFPLFIGQDRAQGIGAEHNSGSNAVWFHFCIGPVGTLQCFRTYADKRVQTALYDGQ